MTVSSKRTSKPSWEAIEYLTVPFKEVTGLDPEIAAFMMEHWSVADIGFSLPHHDRCALELTYAMNPMLLVRRKQGYYVLGSGRALWLAQQLFRPDDAVPALCLKSERVRFEQKLQILSADLITYNAIARTRPHLARRLFALHQALANHGCTAVHETDPETGAQRAAGHECFAIATGFSLDAIRPRKAADTPQSGHR